MCIGWDGLKAGKLVFVIPSVSPPLKEDAVALRASKKEKRFSRLMCCQLLG